MLHYFCPTIKGHLESEDQIPCDHSALTLFDKAAYTSCLMMMTLKQKHPSNRNERKTKQICKIHGGKKIPMKWKPLPDSVPNCKELV